MSSTQAPRAFVAVALVALVAGVVWVVRSPSGPPASRPTHAAWQGLHRTAGSTLECTAEKPPVPPFVALRAFATMVVARGCDTAEECKAWLERSSLSTDSAGVELGANANGEPLVPVANLIRESALQFFGDGPSLAGTSDLSGGNASCVYVHVEGTLARAGADIEYARTFSTKITPGRACAETPPSGEAVCAARVKLTLHPM